MTIATCALNPRPRKSRNTGSIASGGSWTLVWQGGEELRLKAIALDREFSGDQEGWGITDGSAGLRGSGKFYSRRQSGDAHGYLRTVALGFVVLVIAVMLGGGW